MKQMEIGWLGYTIDNADYIPGNEYHDQSSDSGNREWCSGSMNITAANVPDNTNISYFTDAQWSQLGPYMKNANIFWCKASRLLIQESDGTHPLARTVSMNGWMGYTNWDWEGQPYVLFHKTSDITGMSTSDAFVFMDERDDSVDDGYFCVDMQMDWIANVPSNYHYGNGTVTFADGHAEIHKWTTPEFQIAQPSGLTSTSSKFFTVAANNSDMLWLRTHASYHQ